ncbi:MAG: biotin--[acetyl-CoA-carboxylase] ligase [Spirochaetes bacterium]|nr:biotin--[acetyl-CoA-carboxylase] ligase [Spirochaetota bacterium]
MSLKNRNFKNPFNKAPLYYLKETESTMQDALELIAGFQKGDGPSVLHGAVVMAGYQRKGRGRIAGRRWYAAHGKNLLFTLVLQKEIIEFPYLRLPLITGIIIAEVLEKKYALSAAIKWPNDLLYNNRKLAGILCETHERHILVGVGVNCNEEFNCRNYKDTEKKGFFPVSLKDILHREINPFNLLADILYEFKIYLRRHGSGDTAWNDQLKKRLAGINRKVRVRMGTGETGCIEAVITGIDAEGVLILRDMEGGTVKLVSGEIELI